MKDYLNNREATELIILLCMIEHCDNITESKCYTEDELNLVKEAQKRLKQFRETVLDRLGDIWRNKITRTLKLNDLRLASKYGQQTNALSYADSSDIIKILKDMQIFNCITCERKDWKDCGIYHACIGLGIEGCDKENCPFSTEF